MVDPQIRELRRLLQEQRDVCSQKYAQCHAGMIEKEERSRVKDERLDNLIEDVQKIAADGEELRECLVGLRSLPKEKQSVIEAIEESHQLQVAQLAGFTEGACFRNISISLMPDNSAALA